MTHYLENYGLKFFEKYADEWWWKVINAKDLMGSLQSSYNINLKKKTIWNLFIYLFMFNPFSFWKPCECFTFQPKCQPNRQDSSQSSGQITIELTATSCSWGDEPSWLELSFSKDILSPYYNAQFVVCVMNSVASWGHYWGFRHIVLCWVPRPIMSCVLFIRDILSNISWKSNMFRTKLGLQ